MTGAEVVHRLGVVVWGTAAVLTLLVWAVERYAIRALRCRADRLLCGAGPRAVAHRVLLDPPGWWRWVVPRLSGGPDGPGRLRGGAEVVGAVAAGYVLVGGVTGVLAGCVGGLLVRRRRARSAGAAHRNGKAVRGSSYGVARTGGPECEAQVPLAADLLAACVAAGAGPVEAAEAVGDSLGGPVGTRLAQVAAEIRLGGDPARAWAGFGALPGAGGLARLLERATASGAPAAEPVTRLAADCRARWNRAATARARRAAVLVTAPLGLCFLPAFLVVGVAPVLIGLAGALLRGA
ncbi:type II secretion system F family protein [Streptomyces sp. NPDC007088]|uniref:type II secretion system F family protein n=1 Tax=Streptomyces sp. NPDC007088 TaxID=3364773 RepID=UPI0036CAC592